MYLHEMPVYAATVGLLHKPVDYIFDWCDENFESGSYWYSGSDPGISLTLEFDDEHNRTLFLLRWL